MKKFLPKAARFVFYLAGSAALLTPTVHAYVDPATTSYVVQIIAGIVIACGTGIGIFWNRMRRKMKKLVWVMSEKEFEDWFNAWFENYRKYMSKLQRQNVKELFKKLKEDKRLCTQLHCQTEHS